jgi:hypothetical protein
METIVSIERDGKIIQSSDPYRVSRWFAEDQNLRWSVMRRDDDGTISSALEGVGMDAFFDAVGAFEELPD